MENFVLDFKASKFQNFGHDHWFFGFTSFYDLEVKFQLQ